MELAGAQHTHTHTHTYAKKTYANTNRLKKVKPDVQGPAVSPLIIAAERARTYADTHRTHAHTHTLMHKHTYKHAYTHTHTHTQIEGSKTRCTKAGSVTLNHLCLRHPPS